MRKSFLYALALAQAVMWAPVNAAWKPVEGTIMTQWAAKVDPACPLPEYPRPQMVRDQWMNLNGLWDYAVTPAAQSVSAINDGQILVPFCIESALSGVKRTFKPEEKLWYKRSFEIPSAWNGKRVILHFGAVDFSSVVKINGKEAGRNEGGNPAFSFDITDYLVKGKPQEIIVEVTDPSNTGKQPRGKQVLNPKGIWYTPVSGIWKTVWIEPVSPQYIGSYHGVPDIDKGQFVVKADVKNAAADAKVRFTAYDGGKQVAQATVASGKEATLSIPKAKLWGPDSPFLYDLKMEVLSGGKVVDKVDSYFGMRKISIAKDKDGFNRIMLNNEFVFQYGFLDQGWWPDGLLTAPAEEALIYDIQFAKDAGYNTLRKHIKIESDRFYYNCDRMGMIVWQDAVSGDGYNLKNMPGGVEKDPAAAAQFEKELKLMIDQLGNYPCIVNWVVFNEGWGQYGDKRVIDWVKQYDPSRLAEVSGWVDMGNGDIDDIHHYPTPGRVGNPGPNRAFAVGEFGGLGLPVEGHLWNPEMRNWGYATYTDRTKFEDAYKKLVFQLQTMIPEGLSAAIYTQISDVEGEVNGMMTYDRAVVKIPAAELAALHKPLYGTPLKLVTLMDDSQDTPQQWYYTLQQPADGSWQSATEAPAGWQTGKAPFGYMHPDGHLGYSFYERTDQANQRNTPWTDNDIWIWRTFDLSADAVNPFLKLRSDEQVDVYVNGLPVAKLMGRGVHYYNTDLLPLVADGKSVLKKGRNVIAIHAKRTVKPKSVTSLILDAGIVDVRK